MRPTGGRSGPGPGGIARAPADTGVATGHPGWQNATLMSTTHALRTGLTDSLVVVL